MAGLIAFACDNCGKAMKVPESAAGKSGKCKACNAMIVVPRAEIIVPVKSPPPIVMVPERQSDGLVGFLKRLAAGESDDVKKTKIIAKTIEKDRKRKAWQSFWFQIRLGMLAVFVCLVGLVAWIGYVTKDAARITVISSAAPIASPSIASSPAKESKPHHFFDGKKEGKVEKAYEAIKGVEVVHKKDGTTYERRKPKAD